MGGPEQRNAPIRSALVNAMRLAAQLRDPDYNDGTDAWINPIFIVPGSIWRPKFDRYELGHFSPKKKGLVVKIAVPQSVADGDGIREFIGSSLRDAVRLAADKFRSKRISFSTIKAMKLVEEIERRL
jgi:hypothetical protein